MISDFAFQAQMEALRGRASRALPSDMEALRGKAWRTSGITEFEAFWEQISEIIEKGRKSGSDATLDVFKSFSDEQWLEAMLRAYDKQGGLSSTFAVEGLPRETYEPPQWVDMFTTYAMKDSGNRVQTLINQIEINMDAPIREYFQEQFGEEAGTLLAEIMEGLNEQEQERLGKGPKRKVKKPEMSVETIEIEEPSLPEAENEDDLLASLDFLDADIDEILSLGELEDELNLDDLKID